MKQKSCSASAWRAPAWKARGESTFRTPGIQLIYTISCGYAAALNALNFKPTATAGHSLGNWAAGWAAGLYDFKTGLELVTHVEELLEECIPEGMQTMGVVIGLDESVVKSLVAGYPNAWIANWNSPGAIRH